MTPAAADRSARLCVAFSCVGHTTMHLLAALFLTVVLELQRAWQMSYDDLIRLWTLGALLVGLGAPLAGWLGDRWSDSRMMVAMFVVTGGGSVLAALADTPGELTMALAVLGLGASIYHPVGMSWLVKNAASRGKAMGVLGIFGSMGIAGAALVAGGLAQLWDWRAAFLVPGAVSIGIGLVLAALIAMGVVVDRSADAKPQPAPARGDAVRAFMVLSVTMVFAGLAFNVMLTVMPKWFEQEVGGMLAGSTLGVGGMVSLVFLAAALPQFLGGALVDRVPAKRVYVFGALAQAPLYVLAGVVGGWPAVMIALLVVSASNVVIPAENLLLARYTPARHRGLAYGAKFILSFGVAPLAVQLVAWSYGLTADTSLLFTLMAFAMLVILAASLFLPREGGGNSVAPMPAPAGSD